MRADAPTGFHKAFAALALMLAHAFALPLLALPAVPQSERFERLNEPFEFTIQNSDVSFFDVTSDGRYAIYRAHAPDPSRFDVYVARTGSGQVYSVNNELALTFDRPIFLTPDDRHVVFAATVDDRDNIYLAQLNGLGQPRLLNRELQEGRDVRQYSVSPDGQWFVYLADFGPNNVFKLYAGPLDGSTQPILIANTDNTSGDVDDFLITPDSQWVVYLGDLDGGENLQLYSVPITGGERNDLTGTPVPAGGAVESFQVTASGEVVFEGELESSGVSDLYRVAVDGSSPLIKLNTAHPYNLLTVSPSGTYVAFTQRPGSVRRYFVHSNDAGTLELHSGPTVVQPGLGAIAPDDSRLIFSSSEVPDYNLFSVPLDGSKPAQQWIPGATPADGVRHFEITPDSTRVIVSARGTFEDSSFAEVLSAPVDLSEPPIRLSPPVEGNVVLEVFRFLGSDQLVFFGDYEPPFNRELYLVPLDGSAPAVQLTPSPTAGSWIESELEVRTPPGESVPRAYFRGDLRYGNVIELYEQPLDPEEEARVLNDLLLPQTPFDVRQFHFSPDRERVVFFIGGASNGELFSMELDPLTPPVSIRPTTFASARLTITPDSQTVLMASPTLDGRGKPLTAHRIDGVGTQTVLSPNIGTLQYLRDYVLSPDGQHVAFGFTEGPTGRGPYVSPVDGSVEPAHFGPGAGFPFDRFLRFLGDSERVVYVTGRIGGPNTTPPYRLWVSRIDGTGEDVELSHEPLQNCRSLQEVRLAADDSKCVYFANETLLGLEELWAASIEGDFPTHRIAERGTVDFLLTPDGNLVVYVADEDEPGAFELYASKLDGSASRRKLSGTMVAGGDVLSPALDLGEREPQIALTSDGTRVLYVADQENDEVFELFVVPTNGSAPATRVHPAFSPHADIRSGCEDSCGRRQFAISPDDKTVVYIADVEEDDVFHVYSVPLDGSAEPTRLNAPIDSTVAPSDPVFLPDSQRLFFRSDDLWLATLGQADSAIRKTTNLGSELPSAFGTYAGSEFVYYLAEQNLEGVVEFYRSPLDLMPRTRAGDPGQAPSRKVP